jgi:hypothetical protein
MEAFIPNKFLQTQVFFFTGLAIIDYIQLLALCLQAVLRALLQVRPWLSQLRCRSRSPTTNGPSYEKKALPALMVEHFEKYGNTVEGRILWTSLLSTNDPRNIQAILTIQFDDFPLDDHRYLLHLLLGDGIFTLDTNG